MAKSTGIILASGALVTVDLVMTGYDPNRFLRVAVGVVGAAVVSAGLDHLVPGFGTGAAAVLLASVLLTSGVRIVEAMYPATQGFGKR